MADKISALPAASTLDGSELVPVVQGGVTKHVAAAALASCPPGPTPPNGLHLALVNQGADFPLQTIFTPTKAGNYLITVSGIDWAGIGNIQTTMTRVCLGGYNWANSLSLNGPGGEPVIGEGWSEQTCLDGTSPLQMSIINSDPTYAGGTQKYTVYVDIVYLGA